MWVLLLPLGLGSALLPPGPPALALGHGPAEPAAGRGDPSERCGLCHSPHRARAQANGTLGASVTLGCPVAGVPLGQLLAVHWHFWGGPVGAGTAVCSQSRGRPRCGPPYGDDRAVLLAPSGTPGVLVLRHLRDEDAGTYTCLLLGEADCACGEVTLLLGRAPGPFSPRRSTAPPRSSLGLGLLLLLLLLLLLPVPARSL